LNPLLAPIEFPARLAQRAIDGASEALETGRQLVRIASEGVTLLERLDRRAEAIIALGERLDARGAAVLEQIEEVDEIGREIAEQARLVQDRAQEVVDRVGEIIGVIPTMRRAVELVEPLEGTVDVLGRVADRLTGMRTRTEQPPAKVTQPGIEAGPAES
jgi:methyl-accepting chemotaxis protein